MLPSGTSKSGFSGLVIVAFSLSTWAIRLPLARLIVTIIKMKAIIIRFIRMFIQ